VNCDDARVLIHPYLDDEIDLATAVELQRHLAGCPACAHEVEVMAALRSRLKDEVFRFEAPAALKERLRGATPSPSRAGGYLARRAAWAPRLIRIAVPMAVGAMIAVIVVPFTSSQNLNRHLAREVVASHVRSLMASHLMDVASTDQHTVKPWFNGKIDFSPPVNDFAKDGFPLVGGRLDYIDDRPVAALVYEHGKHVINVFMWPVSSGATSAGTTKTQQGYNVEQLTVAGIDCWVVSDLNKRELAEFAQLLRSRG